jgi:hypothetical protein
MILGAPEKDKSSIQRSFGLLDVEVFAFITKPNAPSSKDNLNTIQEDCSLLDDHIQLGKKLT